MSDPFVDTNVLLYAAGLHPEAPGKRDTARRIVDAGCVLSIQILQEFYVQATRPSRALRLSDEDARSYIELLRRFPLQEITAAILDAALLIRARHKFNYWDCAVIAAAIAQGCDTLYSEDLSHGQTIEGVRLVNPFLDLD